MSRQYFNLHHMRPWVEVSKLNFCDATNRLAARARTFEILEHLDSLETEVYKDRDYTMAWNLITTAGKRN